MIDSGSAKASRFTEKDANLTATGTDGSRTNSPSLIDTKLTCLPRDDQSSARRVKRRQLAPEGKTPENFSSNTTGTLIETLSVRSLLTRCVSVALSQPGCLANGAGISAFSIWLRATSGLSKVASHGFKMSVVVWTPNAVVGDRRDDSTGVRCPTMMFWWICWVARRSGRSGSRKASLNAGMVIAIMAVGTISPTRTSTTVPKIFTGWFNHWSRQD